VILRHNPDSFLTGDDPFIPATSLGGTEHRLDQELVFGPHHEGFIGIPHGGLPMGLCLDTWRRIGEPSYPVDLTFRFGGSGVAIGDPVIFSVERPTASGGPRILARITKDGEKTPYLRAEIAPSSRPTHLEPFHGPSGGPSRDLPYYRNCFVCGHHRSAPGLKRRFRVHSPGEANVVTVEWGSRPGDSDRADQFLIGKEELHPAVLISIFDENTGWSGFMATGACALSVKLHVTLTRPVSKTERLLFVGRPVRTRGNPRAPRFFVAEGAVLSMVDPDNPEVVAQGGGEWIVMKQYTRQVKENLLPEDDWQWIFPDD